MMNKTRDILNGYNIELINDKFKVDKIEKIIKNFINDSASTEYIIFLFNRGIRFIINDTLFNIENMGLLLGSFGLDVKYAFIFLEKLAKISKIINMKGDVYLVVKELNNCCFRGV